MKKTILRILLVTALLAATVLSLASCDMLPESITSLFGSKKECTHTEVEWMVDTPATCKTTGVQHSACKACSAILESNVKIEKSDEHELGEWEIDYDATCKATGLRFKKCTVCKRKVEEEIPVSSEHRYDMGACTLCSAAQPPSEGLEFESLGDGTAMVVGLGECKDSSLVIPEATPAGERVVSIDTGAFLYQTSITSVVIPDCVTSSGVKPFQGTSLIRARVPAALVAAVKCDTLEMLTVTGPGEIPASAMADAPNLAHLTVGEGVTAIGNEAFARCRALISVNISPSIEMVIGDLAFVNSSALRSVTLGSGIASIGAEAFRNCKAITNLTIPESVKSIGASAFVSRSKNGTNQSSLSSVSFEVTEGWYSAGTVTDTSGTHISSELLADKSEAAAALHTMYADSYLIRN